MKKLTEIQKLEQQKRLIHEREFKKRYPNGCFSLQIRHGRYGFKGKDDPIKKFELRWGIKTKSTQYWEKSFCIRENGEVARINNSFGYVYNFDSLGKLIKKCDKEGVKQELIDLYIVECVRRGIIKIAEGQ